MSDISGPARRAGVISLAAVLVAGVTVGCSSGLGSSTADPSPSSYTVSVPVVQPGKPGEPATTLAPGQSAPRPPESSWNGADLYFVTMMVQHHTQALRMARLAEGRVSDPQVKAVAARISVSQAPEVLTLKTWLGTRGQKLPKTEAGGHAGHDMPGAVTPMQLEALARTKGPAFDKLFLDLMVRHHAGALQMAGDVTAAGSDLTVQEIAAEMSAGQSAEIRRMEQVRSAL